MINRQSFWENALKPVSGLFFLYIVIEALAKAYGLPHLPAILRGMLELWSNGTLEHDVAVSLARWMSGWIIGSTLGTLLGLMTGRVKLIRLATEGLIVLLRGIPFISLLPLSIRIFGLGEAGKIFLVAWASAGVCWVVVHQVTRNVPQQLIWRATSLGASQRVWVMQVLLPYCREGILSGLRASLSLGLIVIAIAEMSGVYERSSGNWWSEGLGYRLSQSLDQSRDDLLLATILVFSLLGVLVDQLFMAVSSWTQMIAFSVRRRQIKRQVQLARSLPDPGKAMWPHPQSLDLCDLSASYGKRIVVSKLSFHVAPGRTLAVIGPSGSGKTTLLRAIGHFSDEEFRVSGRVTVGPVPLTAAGPSVGIVLQDSAVFDHITVWDNVLFGNRLRRMPKKEAMLEAWHLLCEFGIEEAVTERAKTLSGGQRQRLAFAMVLANRPQILLLDEPFGALDAITRRQLQQFYYQHIHGKTTAVLVTHDINEALILGDAVRVGILSHSKELAADRHGLSLQEWEIDKHFIEIKAELLETLESDNSSALKATPSSL